MPTPVLPLWAQHHDLAVVVEFARMTQAVLDASTCRRYPTSMQVIEFVGALASEFEARHFDTQWGEDGEPDFLEATESFFEAAPKTLWWPSDEDRTRRSDLEYLVALARRVQSADINAAQVLDADAIAQAERDDAALDAAGKRIAAALEAAGVACNDWGDGIVVVTGWPGENDLRVCAGIEHDPDGDHILVDIIDVDPDGDYEYLAETLPVEDLDYIVEQVRDLLRRAGGGAA